MLSWFRMETQADHFGSVFVFNFEVERGLERLRGIKCWTDGFFWNPSRNFLLYREADRRVLDLTLIRTIKKPIRRTTPILVSINTTLVRSSTTFNSDGLMKGVLTLGFLTKYNEYRLFFAIGDVSQQLFFTSRIEDVENGRLRCLLSPPELGSLALDINSEYLVTAHFRNSANLKLATMVLHAREADDLESPSSSPSCRRSRHGNFSHKIILIDMTTTVLRQEKRS